MFGYPFAPNNMFVPREHLVPRRAPARSPWGDYYDPYDLNSSRATPLRGYPHSFPYGYDDDEDEEPQQGTYFDDDEEVDRYHPHHPHSVKKQPHQPHPQRHHQPQHHQVPQQQKMQPQHPHHEQRVPEQRAPNHRTKKGGNVQIPISQGRPEPAPQPVKKVVNYDACARLIQRVWRGYRIRHQRLITKLRLLNKIEQEVDLIKQQNQELLDGIIPPNTPYVLDTPRPIVALEHQLTTILISLDEISVHGPTDIARMRRKMLVVKIEGILSKLDEVKKMVKSENLSRAMQAMEVESQKESQDVVEEKASAESNTEDNEEKEQYTKMEEEPLLNTSESEEMKESEVETDTEKEREVEMRDGEEQETKSDGETEPMVIEQLIEPSQQLIQPHINQQGEESKEKSETLPSTTNVQPATTTTTTRQIPSLKNLCFGICDKVMKQALAHHVYV